MKPVQTADSLAMSGPTALLHLLQLGDSALPFGAAAHSFGMETSIAEAGLGTAELRAFLEDGLQGQGHAEFAVCNWAYALKDESGWDALNAQIPSFKPARESRDASLRSGKGFLALAESMIGKLVMRTEPRSEVHLSAAFGRVGVALEIDVGMVAANLLHQAIFGAIYVRQRLLPFGQSDAMKLLWSPKAIVEETVQRASQAQPDDLWNMIGASLAVMDRDAKKMRSRFCLRT